MLGHRNVVPWGVRWDAFLPLLPHRTWVVRRVRGRRPEPALREIPIDLWFELAKGVGK